MPCRTPSHSLSSASWRHLLLGALALVLGAGLPANARDDDETEDAEKKKHFTADDLTEEQIASITRPPADRPTRLQDGERLTFEIGWSFFDVGGATIEVKESEFEGQPAWHMTMQARTNGFADTFYKVRNTTQSWFTPGISTMLHYEASQREGKREREVVVDIDPIDLTARYTNQLNDDVREPIAIIDGTWDPMSITYFVRSIPLEVGQEFIIPTTNGKKLYLTRVVVKKRETRKFRSGRREAFLLEPDIEDLGGVFKKSKDASVRFWFSADALQLPLRMESEVAVGKFWAELVRVELPPPPLPPKDDAAED